MLEGLHGVENHPECGDNNEQHRDGGHSLGGAAGLWLLQEVPEELLIRHKSAGPEVLHVEEFVLLPGTMCPYRKCRSTSLIGN